MDLRTLLPDLANMADTGSERFRKTWKLYGDLQDKALIRFRDELRVLWASSTPVDLQAESEVHASDLSPLESEWLEHRPDQTLQEFICERWLDGVRRDALLVDWEAGKVKPNPQQLAIVLVWASVQNKDRLRLCKNPDCPARYFIATRKDSRYCSADCQSVGNREAKRKWWGKHRGKKNNQGKKA